MSIVRRFLQVVALICTLLIGVTSMAVIVSQTTWFKEWLRGFIVRQADDYVNGRLSIGRLDGNLFFGVEMEDVDVTTNGEQVVALKDVGVDYNFLTFLTGNVVLDHIRLNEPTIHLQKTAQGWNLANLIKAQTPNAQRNRRPLAIGEIGISGGTLYVENKRQGQPVGTAGVNVPTVIDKIDLSVGVTSDANELKVDVNHAALRAENPHFGVNDLSGIIRRHEDSITIENLALRTEETSLRVAGVVRGIGSDKPVVNVKASSDKFAMGEMANLVPALRGYEQLQPAFEVNASGSIDRLPASTSNCVPLRRSSASASASAAPDTARADCSLAPKKWSFSAKEARARSSASSRPPAVRRWSTAQAIWRLHPDLHEQVALGIAV